MKTDFNELIELAYTYFPKGVSDNLELFYLSKEYMHLQKELEQKKIYISKMANFILELKLKNGSEILFDDLNLILPLDRCIKGSIYFRLQKYNCCLVFYISILIPFYIIYESRYENSLTPQDILQKKYIQDVISKDYLPLFEILNESIKSQFPNYCLMDKQSFSIKVPDISFNGNGLLNSIKSNIVPQMTLFNVFFSDNYF